MILPVRWWPLRYHPEQNRLLRSRTRYKVVVAGRGSGKTEQAKRYLVIQACSTRNGLFFYIAPTLPQAKTIAWKDLNDLIPPEMLKAKWENTCTILLTNGSEIRLYSGERPHRLEGVQWNGGVIDECSDQRLKQLFHLSLGPAMTHKKAWCWLIGVPKRKGIGAGDFKELYDLGLSGTDPMYESFHWKSGDILDEEELDLRRRTLAPQDFREQYEASWEAMGGLVFPDFGPENIRPCIYHKQLPIIVGSDFNVNPMCWTLSHFYGDRLESFAEVFLRDTITPKALDHLYQRYPQHTAGWHFIGDAAARARKTSATTTDYLHIHNDDRFRNKKCHYPASNPPVEDRIAFMNAAIMNAKHERRVFVDPNCKNLIRDITTLARDERNQVIKEGDCSHMSDAESYAVWYLLPMSMNKAKPPSVILAN